MAAFCLVKPEVDKFLAALRDGTIDPAKLTAMTSEERRAFFAKIVGAHNAKEVNTLLEAKLILKDQKRGMVTWAKQVAGLNEKARTDMISRIERMDKVLGAADEKTFLADLAAKRLGADISFDEAKAVNDLSNKVTASRAAITGPAGSPSRLEYGANYVALQNLVHDLKNAGESLTLQDLKDHPLQTALQGAKDLPGLAKSLKASFDDSYAGRQGFRAIFTNPGIWAKNFIQSFKDIAESLKKPGTDRSVMDAVKAEIFSRPNALDDTYKRMKLDVGINSEEAYPSTLPEKVPGLGRLYAASQNAYNAMALRMRADIADQVIAAAKANGVDLMDTAQAESLGKLVNSLTGRGSLGQFEKVGKAVNVWFFSPKSLKASFDALLLHPLGIGVGGFGGYASRVAARNLLRVTAGIATIMGIADALFPGSVEFDPRSADFGKIRIGDTRFDISGGMASLVTLAARLATLSSKSSTTHQVTPLNSGKFGSQTGLDVAVNFLTNKTSPAGSILVDLLKGQTFQGQKPTIQGELYNAFVPFPITNVQEMMSDPRAANPLLGELADAFGIATNTYAPVKP